MLEEVDSDKDGQISFEEFIALANFTSCYEIGMMKPCAENQGACMIEIRKRDGVMESVCMGCKQIAACKANRAQNFWKSRQCRPGASEGPSVCRQCCNTPDCTMNYNPLTVREWKENMMV